MMVYDWSKIKLTTVRDVTDSFHRTCVTFCETADKEVTKTSSSFKMDASEAIKSMRLCKFGQPNSNVVYLLVTNVLGAIYFKSKKW